MSEDIQSDSAAAYCAYCGSPRAAGPFCSTCGKPLTADVAVSRAPVNTGLWPDARQWVVVAGWVAATLVALVAVTLLPMNAVTTDAGTDTASVWETDNRGWWIVALVCFVGLGLLAGFLAATGHSLFAWLALTAALIGPVLVLLLWGWDVVNQNRNIDELSNNLAGLGLGTPSIRISWSVQIGYWLGWVVLLAGGLVGGWAALRVVSPRRPTVSGGGAGA